MKSVILIDKPAGPTSYDVVERICRIIGIQKAGHAGTLDPKVTGLLLIALDEARKCMPLLSGLDKEYVGEILFHDDIDEERIKELAKKFTGKIKQIPPVKSAVARKERERTVHEFEILSVKGRLANFRVLCEAGTYIRKICHDTGTKAGTRAHMEDLRRTKVGPFDVSEAVRIEDFEKDPEKHFIPIEEALKRIGIRSVTVRPEIVKKIRCGAPVKPSNVENHDKAIEKGENIGLIADGELIGIASSLIDFSKIDYIRKDKKIIKTERLLNK